MYILSGSICGDFSKHVIVIHGLFGSGRNWLTFGRRWALEFGYQFHLLDLRNHGESFWSSQIDYDIMAQDVLNYMRYHSISETILIGHSMGGKVAMHLASNHHQRVKKLMVVDIAPRKYPSRYEKIFVGLNKIMEAAPSSRLDADLMMRPYVESRPVRQFLLRNLVYNQEKRLEFCMNVKALDQHIDTLLGAPRLSSPYMGDSWFVWGEQSDYFQQADHHLIEALFPKLRMSFIPQAGHWVHVDNPPIFTSKVQEFLNQ